MADTDTQTPHEIINPAYLPICIFLLLLQLFVLTMQYNLFTLLYILSFTSNYKSSSREKKKSIIQNEERRREGKIVYVLLICLRIDSQSICISSRQDHYAAADAVIVITCVMSADDATLLPCHAMPCHFVIMHAYLLRT